MAVGVVEALEMVHVEHDHAHAAALAPGARYLAPQDVLHVPTVVQPGQGIADGLPVQPGAEPDIGQAQGVELSHALGQNHGRLHVPPASLCESHPVPHQVQQAHELTLGPHGHAQAGAPPQAFGVRADGVHVGVDHQMRAAAPERPAVVAHEIHVLRLAAAEAGHGPHALRVLVIHAQKAGITGENLAAQGGHDSVALLFRLADLEQIAQA